MKHCRLRPAFLFTVICVQVLFQTGAAAGADGQTRPRGRKGGPNIVLIVADDLGYGHLGCYGQKLIRTPNLDRFASEGMRFTQFYAGAPVCASSRCVLMTGYHGGHASVRGNSGGIPLLDDDLTLAEVLKSAGYTTGLFGKWGLGEHGTTGVPNRQGFDEFFGYLHQIHAHFYYPEYLWLNDRKFMLPGNKSKQREQYTHDIIVEQSLAFIRKQRDKPFFLYIPFVVPHYELLVPEDSLKEYQGKFPEKPYTGRRRKTGYPHDYAKQKTPKAALAAMITRMDGNIGRILALIKKLNLDENTIVLFTSDNGPAGGPADPDFFTAAGPLRGYKRSVYEGGLRVPMIVRWPGRIKAGNVSKHVWYFADMLPTLAELAGTHSPRKIDGISAVPTLLGTRVAGRRQQQHSYLYWEHNDGKARAVRMQQWKAVRPSRNAPIELYNLSIDQAEKHNVANKHPKIAARLNALLKTAHTEQRPQIEPKPPAGAQFQ